MSGYARVVVVGHLGRDPETRTTQSGQKVVNLSLAVSKRWRDRNGEQKERTEWIPVVIWNEKLAEIAERYLAKGRQCLIEGEWRSRKWTTNEGVERVTTECVVDRFDGQLVLLGGGDGQRGDSRRNGRDEHDDERPAARQPRGREPAAEQGYADLDDEIPF